tara:strand:- start:561 stop:1667 length:1107 start_codon:yes stop_codon:yes gene_type:complete
VRSEENYLSHYANDRDNNFNLMRFIAATLVLISHSFALALGSSEFEPMKTTLNITWGSIAVDIFFITSGFLIAKSFIFSKNILSFAWARLIRIYPGLIVVIALTVFVLGPVFTELTITDYFSQKQTLKYLIKNTLLIFGIEYNLPGVFLNNPSGPAINGSLWTLPYEVKMYALLAIALIVSRSLGNKVINFKGKYFILLLAFIAFNSHIANSFFDFSQSNFLRLFTMFFVGSAFYFYKDKILLSSKLALILFIAVMIAPFNKEAFYIVYCFALPYLVFYLAYIPRGKIRAFNNFGDYSYGIYIYAFPVQQVVAALITNVSVVEMIVISFFVTLFLAALSWHLIEKHSLKLKRNPFFLKLKLAPQKNVT